MFLCLGARIVHDRTSEPYQTPEPVMGFIGIPIYRRPVSPTVVIQVSTTHTKQMWYGYIFNDGIFHLFILFLQGHSHLTPGQCWAFSGGLGYLVISLPHPFTISHVTLSHISKDVSPTGSISSAPKEFSVYVSHRFNVVTVQKSCTPLTVNKAQNVQLDLFLSCRDCMM